MAIVPIEADGISTDRVDFVGSHRRFEDRQCCFRFGLLLSWRPAFRFAFFNAGGAGAGGTQPGKGPVAGVAIFPDNFDPSAICLVDADMLGIDGFARKFFLCAGGFAGDIVRKNADAFVAHIVVLHLNSMGCLCSPPLKSEQLQCQRDRTAANNDSDKRYALFLHYLVGNRVQQRKQEQNVVPALQLFPSRSAQAAQRVIAGCDEEEKQDDRRNRASVIGEAENIVSQRKGMSLAWLVHKIQPGAST